ncbi:MAG: T9SS type A sorting domain-containing protein [Flavobacteriia bacterium]|nr:T9SS type A sorting domain-containing protein [Flavobacteriia bacterium]
MKKLLLTISVTLFTLNVQAQFGENATWHFNYTEYGYFGHKKIEHVGDTNILGMQWLKFEVTGSRAIYTGPSTYSVSRGLTFDPIFIATRNDSVFRLGVDTALLLYDLNADIGDSWEFALPDTSFGCTSPSKATVVAKGVENIAGANVRYIDVRFPMDTVSYPNGPYYQIVSPHYLSERIYLDFGALFYHGLFAPSPNTCDGTSFQLNMYDLRCFQNDTISFNRTNYPCATTIGLNETEEQKVSIYPNPTHGIITIEFPSPTNFDTEVRVVNIHGQLVMRTAIPQTDELHIEIEETGVYFIHITSDQGRIDIVEKVVVAH